MPSCRSRCSSSPRSIQTAAFGLPRLSSLSLSLWCISLVRGNLSKCRSNSPSDSSRRFCRKCLLRIFLALFSPPQGKFLLFFFSGVHRLLHLSSGVQVLHLYIYIYVYTYTYPYCFMYRCIHMCLPLYIDGDTGSRFEIFGRGARYGFQVERFCTYFHIQIGRRLVYPALFFYKNRITGYAKLSGEYTYTYTCISMYPCMFVCPETEHILGACVGCVSIPNSLHVLLCKGAP